MPRPRRCASSPVPVKAQWPWVRSTVSAGRGAVPGLKAWPGSSGCRGELGSRLSLATCTTSRPFRRKACSSAAMLASASGWLRWPQYRLIPRLLRGDEEQGDVLGQQS